MTPRPYLSWTQMSLLEASPSRYVEVYLGGAKIPINRGMALGKMMADGLENDEATGDPILDMVISTLPKFELMDKEVRATLKVGKETVPLLAKPDTAKATYDAFKEYKTGPAGSWSQKKVDQSGQVTFYATTLYILTKKIPSDIELVHAITQIEEGTGRVFATGEIKRYQTARHMTEILSMMTRMRKAWAQIKDLTEKATV